LFLTHGDDEVIGGFQGSMGAALKLVGNEIMWEEPKAEEKEEKVVVN
jgi:hypothetical protein